MNIEKACRTDARKITDVAIRSKNYWNYGAEQIAAWKEELTVTAGYIDDNQVFTLMVDDHMVGFYAFRPGNGKMIKLDFLFVEPEYIGRGYGKVLMADLLQRVKETDGEKITVDADPNAEMFYKKVGFKVVGQLKSSIKDRFLPIMEMEIKPAPGEASCTAQDGDR
ncbi:GNAT family N-acetyltransferase [Sinomicrobium oceani]|uniref:GNAT family N-acetyltransferase n=1 Tax=Sinomicrobium oceani TaxID=1150368 RepID=UPI00227BE27D|nr:GNAT family N-acetyltransferase [Sinomicrobium oceani]